MSSEEETKKHYEIIIGNIKKKRREKNISKEELSLEIKANKNYINRVEKHELNPSLKYLFKICKVLDIEFIELLEENS